MGLMHATPGDMKSFRSSAERMADIRGAQRETATDQDRIGCDHVCDGNNKGRIAQQK